MKKKGNNLFAVVLLMVTALVISVIPFPDSYAASGYGRTVASNKLNTGADDGIVGAWMCIYDSSMKEPPWLDYFHADGTWDEIYWEYSDGPYNYSYSPRRWEISGNSLIRYGRYGGSEETFLNRTDRNGYTEVTRHTTNANERYVAISDEAYNVLKQYKYSDWKSFDYVKLAKKTNVSVNVAATSITKLSKAKKAFTVKWKKKTEVSGYQIQYGLKKSFKGAKSIYINKAATTSKKIKKLKAKRKYYVRVRSYKVVQGKKYYSKWSAKKAIKTR